MKLFFSLLCLFAIFIAAQADWGAANEDFKPNDQRIQNTSNTTALTIVKPATVTSNFAEFYAGGSIKGYINSNGVYVPINEQLQQVAIGLQTNRCVTTADGTVTNTFPTAFATVPRVFLTQFGTVLSQSNIVVSVTESNCIINCGKTTVTNDVLSIGSF